MPTTSATPVWGPKCIEKKIRIGLVITIKACISIEFDEGEYFVVLDLGDLGTHRRPLPSENKTIFKYQIAPGATFFIAVERRSKTDPNAGYRIVGKVDVPILPDIQLFAFIVKFARVDAAAGRMAALALNAAVGDTAPFFVSYDEDVAFDDSVFA